MEIRTVGVDSVAESDRQFLNANKTNLDPAIKQRCLDIRQANDPIMQHNIQTQLQNKPGKYVILGGCIHYNLARLLNIPSIVLMEEEFSIIQADSLKNEFHFTKMKHNIHIYSTNSKKTTLLFCNENCFFSRSQHASKNYPYGPYSDAYCFSHDPIVDLGKKLSM